MLQVHTLTSAPEASRPVIDATENLYGMVPNLYGVLAESPAAIEAYAALNEALSKTGLSKAEQQVAILATSVENSCTYCVAAHSTVAQPLLDAATIEALRDGATLPEARLNALRDFTTDLVRQRGWVDESSVDAFLDAGFQPANVLDVITIVAMKTLSNYTNHIVGTPLDKAFEGQRWAETTKV